MDALDFAVFREMTRDQFAGFGTLDPRLSTAEIAARLGVDRTTVRDRLASWSKRGFLVGYAILPNPALFGAVNRALSFRVENVLAKPRILPDLALLEGSIGYIDYVGPWVGAGFMDEGRGAFARALKLLERIPGVVEVAPPALGSDVPVTVRPTSLDWRILAALRRFPDAPIAALAAETGVSARTFRRRYERLVQARAVASVPRLDFTKYTDAVLARVLVHCQPGAPAQAVASRLRGEFPESLECATWPDDGVPGGVILDHLLQLPSIGDVERAHAVALALPGVSEVETYYPRRYEIFPAWFDERLDAVLKKEG